MSETMIMINTDEQVKKGFEQACANVGMNVSAGVNILMRLAIREQDLLFGSSEYRYPSKSRSQGQMEALDHFVAAVSEIGDELIMDEDFAILENNRVNFRREIGL